MSMETSERHPRSHLFTVKVWKETVGTERSEWRGKVQLFTSGDVRYFREWVGLVPLLRSMLAALEDVSEPKE
jgi:hypothetical protein